jgi:predicted transcriptional regulator
MEAIEEIIQLLNERQIKDGENGFTRRDLEKYINCSASKADRIINNLLEGGMIEPTRLFRLNRIGVIVPFVGYKLTAKAQDKAAAQS